MKTTVLAWWLWFITLVLIIWGAFALSGCSTPMRGVCAMEIIGKTDSGAVAFQYHCVPDGGMR